MQAGWLAGWRSLAGLARRGAAWRGVAWRGVAGCHAVLSQYVLCLLLLLTAAGYVRLSQTAVLVAIPCEEIYHAGLSWGPFFLSFFPITKILDFLGTKPRDLQGPFWQLIPASVRSALWPWQAISRAFMRAESLEFCATLLAVGRSWGDCG